jgi:DNA-binding CsgD family transcriptional regulator
VLAGLFNHNVLAGQRDALGLLSGFMVFIILVGALFMSNKNNLQQGWGMIRPGSGDELGDDFRLACTLVADGFELTPRELEIFELLAQGRNKAYISQQLFLSKETVKTHTRNLYRKMSLHSQEELIALTAKQIREERSTPAFRFLGRRGHHTNHHTNNPESSLDR